jgi:preprotein translocase subunit SecA
MDPSDPLALQPERLDREGVQPRLTDILPRQPLPQFLARRRDQQRYAAELAAVQAHMAQLALLDEAALKARAEQVADHLKRMSSRGQGLASGPQRSLAMAVAATIAERAIGLAATGDQLAAALAMCDSRAVQLAAGQGKSLAVALAAVLAGWSTRCVHVVCATEPLAMRDAIAMQQLFVQCGLSLNAVTSITPPERFAECYQADVLYGVARRFMADSFRDLRLFSGVQSSLRRRLVNAADPARARKGITRGLQAAVVDDIDRVLIDEATNPLVISEQATNELLVEAITAAKSLVAAIEPGTDYLIAVDRMIEFTPEGLERLLQIEEGLPALWRVRHRRDDLMKQAIIVRDVFKEGEHFTTTGGRLQFQEERVAEAVREKSQLYGLTQALEAHLGAPVSSPPRTVERVSFQGFFSRYPRLGGVACSLDGVGAEISRTYGLGLFHGLAAQPATSTGSPASAPQQAGLTTLSGLPRQTPLQTRHYTGSEAGRIEIISQSVAAWSLQRAAIVICTRRPEEADRLVQTLRLQGVPAVGATPDAEADQKLTREEFLEVTGRPSHVLVIAEGTLTGDRLPIDEATRAGGGLRLLLAQSLDTARAEAAFFGLASMDGGATECLRIFSYADKLLAQHLPTPLPLLRRFADSGDRRRVALDAVIWLARFFATRAARRQRRLLLAREASLRQQLSFAGFGRYSSPASQEPVRSKHS